MKNPLWTSKEWRPPLCPLLFILLAGILTVGAVLAIRSRIQASGVHIPGPSEPFFDIWLILFSAVRRPNTLVILAWLVGMTLIFWLVVKKNPFWNSEQRRLRALWRLMAQLLLLLLPVTALLLFPPIALMIFVRGERALVNILGPLLLPIALFSIWLSGRLLDRRPFADFGFHFSRRWWIDFAFGLALGAVLVVGIFFIERATGWVRYTKIVLSPWEPVTHALVIGLNMFLLSLLDGIQLQLILRGYQMRNLAEGLNLPFIGPRVALLLAYLGSSLAFLLPHSNYLLVRYAQLLPRDGLFNEAVLYTINLIITSLFLGLGYLLTGELAIPGGLYAGWNFCKGLLFGQGKMLFGLLGMGQERSILETFIKVYEVGPVLWTGARHLGLEAGLLGLVAAVVGSLLIMLWVRWRQGRLGLQERLAEYVPPTLPQPQTDAPSPGGGERS